MKKFTEGSYCDVRGWDEELVRKAAKMMAEDLGKEIWEYERSLVVTDLAHYLYLPNPEFAVGVYGPSALGWFGTMNRITKEEVEQMIKEREEAILPLEETEHGLGVAHCTKERPMNTLTKLHQAQETLLQAEQNYTNASEALNTAEEAHTEALEAFRKEAVGLLGERFKTPSARLQEYMDNPLNWEVGDVVVLVSDDMRWTPDLMWHDNICFGDHVKVSVSPYSDKTGRLWFNLKESALNLHPEDFKWHSRPFKR